jgi:ribosomal protein S21
MINVEIKLDPKQSTDKDYFDRKLSAFTREVRRSEVLEDLKWRKCYYKPSYKKRLKARMPSYKWKYY